MILEDDADDEEEDEEVLQLLAAVERDRRAVPKTQNYFEEIIPRFSSSEFQSHFRMSRATFEQLTRILAPDLQGLHSVVPVAKKLSVALWYFGNQDVYRSISDRFDLSKFRKLYSLAYWTRIHQIAA
ncbi:uncharacterized protein LOC127287510 [Leptopilina boulardi]|uniref:uncharacterized protein LOC127287510 n=1 Tax=Leptopilina boulardi TaxID=63433 RepID=UPI0021F66CAB|nr:uncharacterized protein LOC127287510 [Leptopilina boulardi]